MKIKTQNLRAVFCVLVFAFAMMSALATASESEQESIPDPGKLPTKEDAIKILEQLQNADKKRIGWQHQAMDIAYEMAILRAQSMPAEDRPRHLHYTLLIHRSPEWTGKQYIGTASDLLPGIITLARTLPETGSWKPAIDLAGQESVRRWAAYHEVNEDACYGFTDRNGDRLLMHWNGEKLSILCMESADREKKFRNIIDDFDDDPQAAPLQARMVGGLGPYAASVIPFYTAQLKSKQFYTRILAASVLWKIDRKKEVSLPVLSQAFLQAEDPKRKRDAAFLLSGMGPAAMPYYNELKVYLEDPDLSIRAGMAYGLWRIDPGRDEPKTALRKIICNTLYDLYPREQACRVMAQVSPDELMQILKERIGAPDENDAFKELAEVMVNPVGL